MPATTSPWLSRRVWSLRPALLHIDRRDRVARAPAHRRPPSRPPVPRDARVASGARVSWRGAGAFVHSSVDRRLLTTPRIAQPRRSLDGVAPGLAVVLDGPVDVDARVRVAGPRAVAVPRLASLPRDVHERSRGRARSGAADAPRLAAVLRGDARAAQPAPPRAERALALRPRGGARPGARRGGARPERRPGLARAARRREIGERREGSGRLRSPRRGGEGGGRARGAPARGGAKRRIAAPGAEGIARDPRPARAHPRGPRRARRVGTRGRVRPRPPRTRRIVASGRRRSVVPGPSRRRRVRRRAPRRDSIRRRRPLGGGD